MANRPFRFPWFASAPRPSGKGYYRYPQPGACPAGNPAGHVGGGPASSTTSKHGTSDGPGECRPGPRDRAHVPPSVSSEGTQDRQDESHTPHTAASCTSLAAFREFYRSRDGLITVFEDLSGHLTSVDSSRLV